MGTLDFTRQSGRLAAMLPAGNSRLFIVGRRAMFRKYLPVVVSVVFIAILSYFIWPGMQGAGGPTNRPSSANNLDQIGLSILRYGEAKFRYPARANFDKQGKPLLSWRVQILPNLGRIDLYKRFHLDEPWDSEHNKRLIPLMPHLYANPSNARRGMANYLAVCGKGLMFEGEKGRKFDDFKDPTKTIIVVEADDDHAVVWTKPEDWEFDPRRPLAGLGHSHPGGFFHAGGFIAMFADGHVQLIPQDIDPKEFQAMLPIAGSEKAVPPK